MSIWGPVSDEDVTALDFDADGADTYQGTSPATADVHIAVAPSWNNIIRLCVDSHDHCVTLGLDAEAADRLARQLIAAKAIFEAETWRRAIHCGELVDAPNGMVVDIVNRATGEVERLVRADGEWLPRESA